MQQCYDRHQQQGDEHDAALDGIGKGDRQEATDEGVAHGNGGDDDHAGQVVTFEGGLEVAATGDHAGGYVEGEEHQNDDAGGDAQEVAAIVKAILQEGGDRDGVVRHLGVGA